MQPEHLKTSLEGVGGRLGQCEATIKKEAKEVCELDEFLEWAVEDVGHVGRGWSASGGPIFGAIIEWALRYLKVGGPSKNHLGRQRDDNELSYER